jgi:hypothetical protein
MHLCPLESTLAAEHALSFPSPAREGNQLDCRGNAFIVQLWSAYGVRDDVMAQTIRPSPPY